MQMAKITAIVFSVLALIISGCGEKTDIQYTCEDLPKLKGKEYDDMAEKCGLGTRFKPSPKKEW